MTRSFRGPASLLESAPPDTGTWPMTWVLLSREVRRLALPIVVLAVLGGALGGGGLGLVELAFGGPELIDIAALLEDLAEVYGPLAEDRGFEIAVEAEPGSM